MNIAYLRRLQLDVQQTCTALTQNTQHKILERWNCWLENDEHDDDDEDSDGVSLGVPGELSG